MTRLLGTADAMSPLPKVGSEIIEAIERSRLVGRGGAGFPVATKWRAVAQRSRGDAVIVVNGAGSRFRYGPVAGDVSPTISGITTEKVITLTFP